MRIPAANASMGKPVFSERQVRVCRKPLRSFLRQFVVQNAGCREAVSTNCRVASTLDQQKGHGLMLVCRLPWTRY